MRVCAMRSAWRGRLCGPHCTSHPHTQGLHRNSMLTLSLCTRISSQIRPPKSCLPFSKWSLAPKNIVAYVAKINSYLMQTNVELYGSESISQVHATLVDFLGDIPEETADSVVGFLYDDMLGSIDIYNRNWFIYTHTHTPPPTPSALFCN